VPFRLFSVSYSSADLAQQFGSWSPRRPGSRRPPPKPRRRRLNSRYAPTSLRSILSDARLNTASANPSTDRIGVMPNLQAIISSRRNRWWWIYNLAWAWMILLGALLITPGGVLCIKCGPGAPGYIGDVVINVLGVVAIVLGIAAFARRGQSAGVR